jgi:peptidoglycan/xylan/chitin deacetylase (PgdA/CDA1 family)
MPDPIYRVDTTDPVVYLTIDDGPFIAEDLQAPGETTTEILLNKLRELRVALRDQELSATFFLNGWGLLKATKAEPDNPLHPIPTARRRVAERILAEGHDIANHSFYHRQPWGWDKGDDPVFLLPDMLMEIQRTEEAFGRLESASSATGRIVTYFRAAGDPSYYFDPEHIRPGEPIWCGGAWVTPDWRERFERVLAASDAAGLRYVTYNIRSRDDGLQLSAEWVYGHAIHASCWSQSAAKKDPSLLSFEDLEDHPRFRTKNGAILLTHSGRCSTVQALGSLDDERLPGILPYIYSQGFTVRRLPRGL